MRIDLPRCNFKNCKYHLDCNCTSQNRYDTCEFREAKEEVEVLNAIIKEDCGMLPDYETYLGNKIRKEFAGLLVERIKKNITPIPQQMYLVRMCIQEINSLLKESEEK